MNDSNFIDIKSIPLTGIGLIDNQHKFIIETLNQLNTVMLKKQEFDNTKIIIDLIEILDQYTSKHFDTEEYYMKKYNFPDYEKHKQTHNYFKQTYNEIRNNEYYKHKSASEESPVLLKYTMHLMMLLKQWIEIHFTTYDKKLSDFIKNKIE